MSRTPFHDDLLVWTLTPGQWYRFEWYQQGKHSHKLHREEPDITWCGRMAWPNGDVLDMSGIEHWRVVEETRQSGHCTSCRDRENHWLEVSKIKQAQADRTPMPFFDFEAGIDALPRLAKAMIGEQ